MNPDILTALKQIEKERNIPLDKVLQAFEDALVKAYEKRFGVNQHVIIEIDRESGQLCIWQRKLVVPEVVDPDKEMSLEKAQELSEDAEVGMELDIEVPNEAFGRIAAQTAKQVIYQRIREFERDMIRDEFIKRQGEVLSGTVNRFERREIIVDLGRDLGKADGVIPVEGQAHGEFLRNGDRIRALVVDVREGTRGAQVVLSRSSPELLKCLFESHVPEIGRGIVQIKAVVREAGLRSKIAVKSTDPNIDPVGACVGPKGTRVQSIVDELRNEKIDVIPWSDDPMVFVANSLQPSRVTRVTLHPDTNEATVVVPDQQLPLAIGREGQNARLAAKLTGWHIDIKSESSVHSQPDLEASTGEEAPAPTEAEASAADTATVEDAK